MKRMLKMTIGMTLLLTILCSCGNGSGKHQLDLSQNTIDASSFSLEHGDLINVTKIDNNGVVVKAKIKPSYDNEATVNQNYYNIYHLIQDNGFDVCSEIQYWAVADMSNGSEEKVVSFTVNEDLIKKIKDGKVVANELGDYVDDLFLHQSLR